MTTLTTAWQPDALQAAAASDTILQLPLAELRDSPFNPRKTFKGIEDLAGTIKSAGRILQPLLVRPIVMAQGLARRADDVFEEGDTIEGLEIVFGHRRKYGAMQAGLETAPCMVHFMSDEQARRAQHIENLQRQDVHPIEEAEGFKYMMEHDKCSAAWLADQFKVSESYVYGRLQLLQAIPQLRQACIDGELGADAMLLVARVGGGHPKLQEQALNRIRNKGLKLEDGGKISFRRIRDLLAEEFTLTLKSAIFDPEDASLLPAAGTCTACPHRTGNAPHWADVTRGDADSHWHKRGGPDVCTNPQCFNEKKAAHLARKADQLKQTGAVVLNGNKARQVLDATGKVKPSSDYVPLADVREELKKASKGHAKVQEVTILDQRSGKAVKAVKREDLQAAGVKVDPAPAKRSTSGSADWEREQREAREERGREEARRAELYTRVRAAMVARAGMRTADDLRSVVLLLVENMWHQQRVELANLYAMDSGRLETEVATLGADDLATMTLDIVLLNARQLCDPDGEDPLHQAAARYNVDIAPPPPPEEAATPAPKAAATKPPKGVKYRDPATGNTWTGRGLQPAWLKAQLAQGRSLTDFDVTFMATEEVPA